MVRALHGRLGPHQRLMLGEQLHHIDEFEGRISRLNKEIERRLAPFAAVLEALDAIPGVGRRAGLISGGSPYCLCTAYRAHASVARGHPWKRSR